MICSLRYGDKPHLLPGYIIILPQPPSCHETKVCSEEMHREERRPVSSVEDGRTVDTTTCLHATNSLNDLFKLFKDFLLFNLDRLPSGSGFLVILLKSRTLFADLGQPHIGALFEQPMGCRLAPR